MPIWEAQEKENFAMTCAPRPQLRAVVSVCCSVRLQRGRDAAGGLRLRWELFLQSRVCRATV